MGNQFRSLGWDVTGWVRTSESGSALRLEGWRVVEGDAAVFDNWVGVKARELDVVVFCPSTGGGDIEDYQSIHIQALANALESCPHAHFVYTSATSVYGQNDGSWVSEESETVPAADTSKVLLEAERLVISRGGCVLRVSAIYGPGRGVLLQRLLKSEAFIPDGPERWINMIHRDDVAGAIRHGIERRLEGVFNATDDEPVTYQLFYQWLCEKTGRAMPLVQAVSHGLKKRGLTRKQVSNAKLRAQGWPLGYPTFREGYEAVLSEA